MHISKILTVYTMDPLTQTLTITITIFGISKMLLFNQF